MNLFTIEEDVLLRDYIVKKINEILEGTPFSKTPIGISAKSLQIDPRTPGLKAAMKKVAGMFDRVGWMITYGVHPIYGYTIVFSYPLSGYGLGAS